MLLFFLENASGEPKEMPIFKFKLNYSRVLKGDNNNFSRNLGSWEEKCDDVIIALYWGSHIFY